MVNSITYDDDLIAAIDHEMGWDDPPEDAPSAIAKAQGAHVKFLGRPFFDASAWFSGNVWSICVLKTYGTFGTTLLAKSFPAVSRLYAQLMKRRQGVTEPEAQKWGRYYSHMWERRYRKWCCTAPNCECQLCRMAKSSTESL